MSGAKKKSDRRASLAEMGLTEREKRELKEKQAHKRNTILAVIAGVIVVALVVALLVWHSGIIPRHTTALTVKDHKYTVADMDYYYHTALNQAYSYEQSTAQFYTQNNLGEYTPAFDPNADLTAQFVDEEQTQSYHDYFLQQAKDNVVQLTALYDAAQAAGHTLSEDAKAELDEALSDLDAAVSQYNFGSRSAYLKAVYGRNMTEKVYVKNQEMFVTARDYYNSTVEKMTDYSDEDLKAYYQENPGALDSYSYDYVYFDGTVKPTTDADGNELEVTDAQTEAALAEAKKSAEDLKAAVDAAASETPAEGEAKKTFSTLASDQGVTATARTNQIGTGFSSMPYAEWLMDTARKDGDTETFEVEGSGWYVVQFHSRALYDEPTVDARHILFGFEAQEGVEHERDASGNIIYTDAEKQAAHDEAAAILEQFNQGEKTAEAFSKLAEEHSDDGRNEEGALATEGGLYTNIHKGEMVKPFEDWCFDASRAVGDTGLVETTFGWHVMYFDAYHRPAWMDAADEAKSTADQTAFLEKAEEGYEAVDGSGLSQVGLA